MMMEDRRCLIPPQLRLEAAAEKLRPHVIAQYGHGLEVGVHRVSCHVLERCLRTKHARRPVSLGIRTAKQSEQWASNAERECRTHTFFHQMHAIAPVTAKGFIAAVPRQCHCHVLTCKLTDSISRYGRAVGVRLVVK